MFNNYDSNNNTNKIINNGNNNNIKSIILVNKVFLHHTWKYLN